MALQGVKGAAINVACSRPAAELITAATGGRVPSSGLRVDLRHPDVPPRIRAAVFWRLYERAEIGLIHQHLPRDLDVVELGSSFGVTGAHALSVLEPDRQLIAVEANPHLLPALRSVLGDQAEVVHGAVAYGEGETVTFHVDPINSLHSRMNARGHSVATEVPRFGLSDLLTEHQVGEYSLVADIEGAEAGILREDPGALDRCRMMLIELHTTTYRDERIDRLTMAEEVRALGFRQVAEERRTIVFVR